MQNLWGLKKGLLPQDVPRGLWGRTMKYGLGWPSAKKPLLGSLGVLSEAGGEIGHWKRPPQ